MSDAPGQLQEVRVLVRQTEASLGQFEHVRGDSVGCITDVAFVVETWRDAHGVVRKLRFESQSLMGYGGRTQVLYRDAQGRPRSLLHSETDGFDFSRPTEDQHPASGTTELFINPAGRLIGRTATGNLKSRPSIAWPQVLEGLNPQELFRRYTCKR